MDDVSPTSPANILAWLKTLSPAELLLHGGQRVQAQIDKYGSDSEEVAETVRIWAQIYRDFTVSA